MGKDVLVGGQAVIEGVLMRNKDKIAIAVRREDKSISVKKERVGMLTKKYAFLGLPFVRGTVNLIETLVVGIRALNYSANESINEEEEKITKSEMIGTTVFALVVALGLFLLLPLVLTKLLPTRNEFQFNIIDGVIRLVIFLVYVLLISMMSDVKRIFQYHGAEHKSVNCYESGKSLTLENVRKCSLVHRRCGTTFLLIVMAISIVVFSFIISDSFWVKFGGRIVLMPVVAGISYELLKAGAKYPRNILLRAMVFPGLMLQKLTTREPDDTQLEVAIKALQAVVGTEKRAKIELVL